MATTTPTSESTADDEHRRLPGAELVDRGLDRIEECLPALPAAVFRLQRSVAERIAGQGRHALCAVGDAEVAATTAAAVHGTTISYRHWTKKDLYELAQDLDIDGRSAMAKNELITAIESAR